MPKFTRFDKLVSDALIDRWEQAEHEGDETGAEAIKRALSHLGLPWVRIVDEDLRGTYAGQAQGWPAPDGPSQIGA